MITTKADLDESYFHMFDKFIASADDSTEN